MAKVLFIDDDVVNSQLFVNKLTSEGHTVELVTDGTLAQQKTGEKYNLILLDVMMPGVDGFSLLQEFRKGSNKQTPIFMFTNLVSDETKKHAAEYGATELLYKADTTPQDLIAKIHDHIGAAPKKDQKNQQQEVPQETEEESTVLKEAAE